jgi:hypothetical protein
MSRQIKEQELIKIISSLSLPSRIKILKKIYEHERKYKISESADGCRINLKQLSMIDLDKLISYSREFIVEQAQES